MKRDLPDKGFVFWPVGTGDSISIIVSEDDWMQVDLHQTEAEDGKVSIVEELVENLPQKDGKPYLAVFALTHPDKDHCNGFSELLEKVTIGELWFTPRVFTEHQDEFCEDACSFQEEAMRRIGETSKGKDGTPSGDKAKIIGYHKKYNDQEFNDFPDSQLVIPGTYVQDYDGKPIAEDEFKIFIHAPLQEAIEEDRNNTSLAMQVSLNEGDKWSKALLFGDLAYLRINEIFEITEANDNADTLEWNILLAPHHCSKSVMYHKDENGVERYKPEIIDYLNKYKDGEGVIVASSEKVPASNNKGDNPPHAKAKSKYLDVVSTDDFVCTQEHSSASEPSPVILEADNGEISIRNAAIFTSNKGVLSKPAVEDSLREVENDPRPPSESVRYGKK